VARSANETVRLFYHARTLLVPCIGIGVVIAVSATGLVRQLGTYWAPLVLGTIAVLAAFAWLGWIDYVSATTLKIDPAGVTIGWPERRAIPWSAIRGVTRATGAFRLALRTERGKVRLQLLALSEPIPALRLLLAESARAGAKVEPYLERHTAHLEEPPDFPEP
jgi:hypothetical protein